MASRTEWRLVLSSEHGSNHVPQRHRALFEGAEALLTSHRGYDMGSAELARALARRTGAPLFEAAVTRLLVDCNRSPGHRALFSDFTRSLPAAQRTYLVDHYYRPYRDRVTAEIRSRLRRGGAVLHVSVHSFTRCLHGERRNADIGLLYDPSRAVERELCLRWQKLLGGDAAFRVRRNYPYRGVADGLVTALRRSFPEPAYAGVGLEVCQDIAGGGGERWHRLKQRLGDTLSDILQGLA